MGIYWLKVTGDSDNPNSTLRDTSQHMDWRNDASNQFSDYRLIVISDLGVIAKKPLMEHKVYLSNRSVVENRLKGPLFR